MIKDQTHMSNNCVALKNFIDAQLNHRSEISSLISNPYEHFENSIIHCSGMRRFGSSNAVYDLFDPKHDIYIGHRASCDELKLKLKQQGINANNACLILDFNSIDNANYDVNLVKGISDALEDALDNYVGLHVPLNKYKTGDVNKENLLIPDANTRQYEYLHMFQFIENYEIDMVSYVKKRVNLPNRGVESAMLTRKLLSFKSVSHMAKVYVDIGISSYMANNMRVYNMLGQIYQILKHRCKDLVFIIT